MFKTIEELIEAIAAEENENARVQVYVSDLGYRFSIDFTACNPSEKAVYSEADCPSVADFCNPLAIELLEADINKID